MCAVDTEGLGVLDDGFGRNRSQNGCFGYVRSFFPLQANTGYKQPCNLLIDPGTTGRRCCANDLHVITSQCERVVDDMPIHGAAHRLS